MKRAWWGSRQRRQVHQIVKVAVVTRDVRGYCMLECGADINADSCLRKDFLWAQLPSLSSSRVLECL
jgi:hypothetical protein